MIQLKSINSRARTKSQVGFLLYSIVLFLNNKLDKESRLNVCFDQAFFSGHSNYDENWSKYFSGQEKNTFVHVIS